MCTYTVYRYGQKYACMQACMHAYLHTNTLKDLRNLLNRARHLLVGTLGWEHDRHPGHMRGTFELHVSFPGWIVPQPKPGTLSPKTRKPLNRKNLNPKPQIRNPETLNPPNPNPQTQP